MSCSGQGSTVQGSFPHEGGCDTFNVVVAAFHEIFWVLFFFICLEDELQWLGRVLDPDFVMSEEELLLGQVSFTAIGLE